MGRCLLKSVVFLCLLVLGAELPVAFAQSQLLSQIPLGKEPTAIAIDSSRHLAVVADEKLPGLYLVDLQARAVTGTVKLGKEPEAVAVDPVLGLAVMVDEKVGGLLLTDLATQSLLATIPVGKKPFAVAVDTVAHLAAVLEEDSKSLVVVDLLTRTVLRSLVLGKDLQAIAIHEPLHQAVVLQEKPNQLILIDLLTGATVGTVPLSAEGEALGVLPDPPWAVVGQEKPAGLVLVDLATRQVLATIPLTNEPEAVTVHPVTGEGLVLDEKARALLRVNLDTRTLQETIPLPEKPEAVAVDPALHLAAVILKKDSEPGPKGALQLLQLPYPAPTLTTVSPAETLRNGPAQTLTLTGMGFFLATKVAADGQALTTTYLSPTELKAELPAGFLTQAQLLQVAVQNPAPGGGTSATQSFTVKNPVPMLTALSPTEALAGSQALTLTLTGTNFVPESQVSFAGQALATTYNSPTQLTATVPAPLLTTAGTYPVTIINPAPGGGTTASLSFTVKPPLQITITSPASGSTIASDKVIVQGTLVTAGQEVGVTVNSLLATVSGTQWVANQVPLQPGPNTLTATATDAGGNTATASVTVQSQPAASGVTLHANLTSGTPPLEIRFSFTTTGLGPIASGTLSFGDGSSVPIDPTQSAYPHTYTTESLYTATLTVTDSQGQTAADTLLITILSRAQVDALLQAKWVGMKGKLTQGDIEGALAYFLEKSRERYRTIFTALKGQLLVIGADLPTPQLIYVVEGVAKYRLRRQEPAGLLTYYLYFEQDGKGIWRIRQF